MSEHATFQFKCARCGVVHNGASTSVENAHDHLGHLILGWRPSKVSGQPMAPAKHDYHRCNDGGVGISDLIGYEVTK